jgi:hypothetical protein
MSSKPYALANPVMTKRSVFWSQYFYFSMSLLVAAVIVYGFSHTIDQNLIHPKIPRPRLLYFHAALFTGWLVFFILQSLLVRTHGKRRHVVTSPLGFPIRQDGHDCGGEDVGGSYSECGSWWEGRNIEVWGEAHFGWLVSG